MAFDSTADLLFRISANSDDAAANITRFRALLSKDLGTIGSEFSAWSEKIFGNLKTVGGATTAAVAAVGAAGVAAAAYAASAAEKYAAYVEQIHDGSEKTGIAVEDMSKLRFAAESLGVNYDRLVTGLTRFTSAIYKANEGGKTQEEAFRRLGLSQADVAAGEQNMLPLLMRVADAYAGARSQVEKTAIARELFSRGGAELVEFLQLGSKGLQEFAKRAEELGIVLTDKDVIAVKEFQIALRDLKATKEALDLSIGQATLPLMIGWQVSLIGLIEAVKNAHIRMGGLRQFFIDFAEGTEKAAKRIAGLVQAATSQGDRSLLGPDASKGVKQAAADFTGLSSVLEGVRQKTAGTGNEMARAVSEIQHVQFEAAKATREFQALVESGKISGEALRREAAALTALPAAIIELGKALDREIVEKRNAAVAAAADELRVKLAEQQQGTWQAEQAGWASEITKLRDHLAQKGALTAENTALLAQLEEAGSRRIERTRQEAWGREIAQVQEQMAAIVMRRMTTRERLEFEYDSDLQKFSQVEEEKLRKAAGNEAELEVTSQTYALLRKARLQEYGHELQALANSEGWRAVLGSEFGQMLRSDEEAWRRWSETADQALTMVALRSVAVNAILQQGFQGFSRAMGQNIAQALVYQQSIGEAMRAACASALASIAAESLVQAIYATAMGFLRLAQHDYAAAGAAFQSAALFGSVGAVAAVAGRMVAPRQGAAGGTERGVPGSTITGAAAAQGGSNASGSGSHGPGVTVIVQGPIIGAAGIEQLTDMINEAVTGRDVRLIATQVKQGTRAVR